MNHHLNACEAAHCHLPQPGAGAGLCPVHCCKMKYWLQMPGAPRLILSVLEVSMDEALSSSSHNNNHWLGEEIKAGEKEE